MNSIETILYTWLTNDYDAYAYIMDNIETPRSLRVYVAEYEFFGLGELASGILGDILKLVNWQTLYERIKD